MNRVIPAWERPGFCPHPSTGSRTPGGHNCGWCGRLNPWRTVAIIVPQIISARPPWWKRTMKLWLGKVSFHLPALLKPFIEGLVRRLGERAVEVVFDLVQQIGTWSCSSLRLRVR